MEGFYKSTIMIFVFIFCFFFLTSSSQCQYGPAQYPPYGIPYGIPYGTTTYGTYGPPPTGLGGYAMGNSQYYPNYGYSPSQPYGGIYRQPYNNQPYYGYSQPQNYGGYPYRQPNYNQQYNYGAPSGYYTGYNNMPYQYFGDPYTQQNPIYNPYGVSTGDWEDWSYLPSRYKDADLILDENDNNDDFTVDVGDSIAIILPSQMIPGSSVTGGYEWAFDDDDFDDDIISHNNTSEWFSGYQFWYFEAEEVGTTTIKMGDVSWLLNSSIGEDEFEVEITVEED